MQVLVAIPLSTLGRNALMDAHPVLSTVYLMIICSAV